MSTAKAPAAPSGRICEKEYSAFPTNRFNNQITCVSIDCCTISIVKSASCHRRDVSVFVS